MHASGGELHLRRICHACGVEQIDDWNARTERSPLRRPIGRVGRGTVADDDCVDRLARDSFERGEIGQYLDIVISPPAVAQLSIGDRDDIYPVPLRRTPIRQGVLPEINEQRPSNRLRSREVGRATFNRFDSGELLKCGFTNRASRVGSQCLKNALKEPAEKRDIVPL